MRENKISAHKDIIDKLATLGFSTKKFYYNLRKLDKDFKSTLFQVIPDAYYIDYAKRTITCVEVENYHRFNKAKNYAMLNFMIDCCDWACEVFLLDRYGNIMKYFSDDELWEAELVNLTSKEMNSEETQRQI